MADHGQPAPIQVADHLVLTDLLRRIMKQEGRHIDYYLTQSRERLASPRAQRVTRGMIQRLWEPVGAQVMPAEETRHLVRTLFAGPDGRASSTGSTAASTRCPGSRGSGSWPAPWRSTADA